MSQDDDKKGSVSSLDERRGVQKKGHDTVTEKTQPVDRPHNGDEKLAGGHTTGGEMVDAQGNIDSTQSAKPVPRDVAPVDIASLGPADGVSGNVAQPGHDNAKMAQGEKPEDVDGEIADDDDEDLEYYEQDEDDEDLEYEQDEDDEDH